MRNIQDLEENALKFWPANIAQSEKNSSIIPKLIETQDKFISLLNIADSNPYSWKEALNTSSLKPNLFLKHLIVLTDIGGEKLMRFKKELPSLIGDKLIFIWKGVAYDYQFKSFSQNKTWSNTNLFVDGEGIDLTPEMSPLMEDVCMLLLFGGSTLAETSMPEEILDKCVLGAMLGKNDELSNFVKQRYIWVSRITGGATANSLGQLTELYVKNYLEDALPSWRVNKDQLKDVSHNERTPLSVDIVLRSPTGKYCAIEVSFQVTTNSTIERKAGQAQARQELLHRYGHKIAYVIDGAGNFARESALKAICQYSDCTVSFSDHELDKLVSFLEEMET